MAYETECQTHSPPVRYKYIQRFISRHGRECYYFRRPGFDRIRLPGEPGSVEFDRTYRAAFAGLRVERPVEEAVEPGAAVTARLRKSLMLTLARAKKRAVKKGIAFGLTINWAMDEVERNQGRCSVTGVRFFAHKKKTSQFDPYAPSFDRMDCSAGYTEENVRIVLTAVNIMMSDWGPEVFERVARAYQQRSRQMVVNAASVPVILRPKCGVTSQQKVKTS